ncbi:MAG: pyruvate dehydrogenase [Deltaproteobacteria bacterium]|nr:pyruvate dehydrogenase [Deltaproteobacteria bacterium]
MAIESLYRINDRAFFMALKMIDIANRRSAPRGEPKTGGHPSACASSQHILSTIHLVLRKPQDYFAGKPHSSPMDHALNFLLHNFRDQDGIELNDNERKLAMHHLRHYSREGQPVFQSYHAESDPDSFRIFPSGSVGIPPVTAIFTALAYQYVQDHGYELNEQPFFWCTMGDSEFREGSLMEAMPDAAERELGRVIWIVDYNRQNLDGTRILNEAALGGTDAARILKLGSANGWETIDVKHGKKRQKLFEISGGNEFRRVLDQELSDFEFQALVEANRPELTRSALSKKSHTLGQWLESFTDTELQEAFLNVGGHDIECLLEACERAKLDEKKPTLIVAHTIKGFGLRCQAQSGNHSTLPEDDELKELSGKLGLPDEDPFLDFIDSSPEESFLKDRRKKFLAGIRKIAAAVKDRQNKWIGRMSSIHWPLDFDISALRLNPNANTQWMWGQIATKLDRLSQRTKPGEKQPSKQDAQWAEVAPFFITLSPDVGTSTNIGPKMHTKLYGAIGQQDFEQIYESKDPRAPDIVPSRSSSTGHLRFEITEANCMSALGAFGKFYQYEGIPYYPAMTVYDFFVKRCHDQFYYNVYWHSHCAVIGTPSGVSLAPEGAQHSWKSDFQVPNCVTWEPAFAKEVEWIIADALRRHFTLHDTERETALIRCVTKGVVQKEFLERLRRQTRFSDRLDEKDILEQVRLEVLKGGYPLIDHQGSQGYEPGDNVVHIFSMGPLVREAIKASDELFKEGIHANVYVVTSPELLLGHHAFANHYDHLRTGLGIDGNIHLHEREIESIAGWLALEDSRIPIVSVHDGEPGLLDNIGSVLGVPHKALAVRRASKSGNTTDIYHFHGIDSEAIVEASKEMLELVAGERFKVHRSVETEVLSRSLTPIEK